jgi:hypothetical protein
LDSRFSNGIPAALGSPAVRAEAQDPAAAPQSPATERFHSCRWRKPAENALPDHCTHRDVLPMAGTAGFVPDSWCPDCAFYKAKRTPRKRQDEPQDNWRRW